MADTAPRTRPATRPRPPGAELTTDLIVVGGGPAGCAAVRTAAGVGLRTILIEADALCGTLHRIPVLDNVLGGWTGGPELAASIAAEVTGTPLCRLELGSRVTEVHADDDRVTVTVAPAGATAAPAAAAPGTHRESDEVPDPPRESDGVADPPRESGEAPDTPRAAPAPRTFSAPYAVLATGVVLLGPGDVPWITWITGPAGPPPLPLRQTDATVRTILVLGGDRPVGTFLRAHPDARTRLLVAYPPPDAYKTDEVRGDPRVTLLPVEHVRLIRNGPGGVTAELTCRDGERRTVTADAVRTSIGSAPRPPGGALVRAADGYCPPGDQHPRVLVAGDLRAARYQRIMTAMGSGGEAALRAYYASLTP
ncbi:pyridine nucleotide-disulfide oxidoreductase [Streptomyces sp. NPDC087908]